MKYVLVLLVMALAGCASQPKPVMTPAAAPNDRVVCDLVCERAKYAVPPAPETDYSVKALANVNTVLESLQPDMLACYTKRVAVYPNAHAFITVDVVIDEAGKVASVETTGGALLGPQTMACITNKIREATFDPPHNGGTLHVHVPFSLRPVADDT